MYIFFAATTEEFGSNRRDRRYLISDANERDLPNGAIRSR